MSANAGRSDVVADPVGHISISGVHGGDELARRVANAANGTGHIRAVSGNALAPLLLGAAVGLVVMYLFDPGRGNRRRALLRDRLEHARHAGSDSLGHRGRDLRNRASGAVAGLRSHVQHDEAGDAVLVDRVRSALGRVVSRPSAIDVTASDREVTLSGRVRADEAEELLDATRHVKGVDFVVNHLDVRSDAW